MKAFLKTIIGGALGLGALYVVGKICYEAGKDVAEVERQLREKEPELHAEQIKMDLFAGEEKIGETTEPVEEPEVKHENRKTMLGRFSDKVKNARTFLFAKKVFDKSNRKPGILSSLLTNPDGARIEAVVRDGGVQISVKPRAA